MDNKTYLTTDELSERIESALRLVRGARPVAPVLASAARTDAAALRKDLHRVHALVEQLVQIGRAHV